MGTMNAETREAVEKLKESKQILIPFIGAGFSVPACPLWSAFLEDYYHELKDGNFISDQDQQDYEAIKTNAGLDRLERMADALYQFGEKRRFTEAITKHFGKPVETGMINKFNLLHRAFPVLKITTNFDNLIENSASGFHVDVCRGHHAAEMQRLLTVKNVNCLLKIHGSLTDSGSIVLTRKQYAEIYGHDTGFNPAAPLPDFLIRVFTNNTVLFIGCSLESDRVLEILKSLPDKHPPHAILRKPGDHNKLVAMNRRLSSLDIIPLWIKDFSEIETILEMLAPGPAITGPDHEGYRQYHLKVNRHLQLQGFETACLRGALIEMEKVYVTMRASLGGYGPCEAAGENELFGMKKQRLDHFAVTERRRPDPDEMSGLVDIKGALAKAEREEVSTLVILGDPGSGKSTLLKYILVMMVRKKTEDVLGIPATVFPFLVPLRDLRDPAAETFEQFLDRVCLCAGYGISVHEIERLLNHEPCLVMLDGLDEVADENVRIKVCGWIDNVRRKYLRNAGLRFIVTSRFAGYIGKVRLGGLPVLELAIQDFAPADVRRFLVQWFETVHMAISAVERQEDARETGKNRALALIAEIEDEKAEHIRKLTVNPLLLQIIALLRFDSETPLPQRRVELYQKCVDLLLAKWDMAKGLPVMLDEKEARLILQPVALWLHRETGRRSATLPDGLEAIITKALAGMGKSTLLPGELLRNIRERNGIFTGYGTEEYGFTHQSFQEFFTAEEVRNTNAVQLLARNYGEKWWREVIRLAAGLTNPSIPIGKLTRRVLESNLFAQDFALLNDCIRDSLSKPFAEVIRAVHDEKHPVVVRSNAMRVLETMGGELAIQCLRQETENPRPEIARAAYDALSRLGAADGLALPAGDEPARIISEKDGAEMVFIPAGMFLYGSREDDKEARTDEKPQRSIFLSSYYLDVYPVTNARYCRFLNERQPGTAELEQWISLGQEGFGEEKNRLRRHKDAYAVESDYENHPVIMVSWFGAGAYARWAGKRLPTEAEWEKAARGTDGRPYPWGNAFDETRCNFGDKYKGTTAVDRFPRGISPYGCHDLAGNVWEWCADWYGDRTHITEKDPAGPADGADRVIRGGSWLRPAGSCRAAFRYGFHPGDRFNYLGFRLAAGRSGVEPSKGQDPAGPDRAGGPEARQKKR